MDATALDSTGQETRLYLTYRLTHSRKNWLKTRKPLEKYVKVTRHSNQALVLTPSSWGYPELLRLLKADTAGHPDTGALVLGSQRPGPSRWASKMQSRSSGPEAEFLPRIPELMGAGPARLHPI